DFNWRSRTVTFPLGNRACQVPDARITKDFFDFQDRQAGAKWKTAAVGIRRCPECVPVALRHQPAVSLPHSRQSPDANCTWLAAGRACASESPDHDNLNKPLALTLP